MDGGGSTSDRQVIAGPYQRQSLTELCNTPTDPSACIVVASLIADICTLALICSGSLMFTWLEGRNVIIYHAKHDVVNSGHVNIRLRQQTRGKWADAP